MGLFKRHGSEPAYGTPKCEGRQPMSRRNAQPGENYYGPHFDKGPQQEEIFDRRAAGERFPRDHPELRDRAHSFQHPIQQHKYSVPYKKMPQPWKGQMQAEHEYYHGLSDRSDYGHKEAVKLANRTEVGQNHVPTNAHGRVIEAGIASAIAGRTLSNRAVQARQGFAQKYPQAYENDDAIKDHHQQVKERRNQAARFRRHGNGLEKKHDDWATQMRGRGIPFEGSYKR